MAEGGTSYFQGGHQKSSHDEFSTRHGLSSNLSDAGIQQKLDEMREDLKKEIRKEMKIKEGAERLREVTTDKKSLSNINSIVKKSNTKLTDLHEELKDLNAYLISKNDSGTGELSVFFSFLISICWWLQTELSTSKIIHNHLEGKSQK